MGGNKKMETISKEVIGSNVAKAVAALELTERPFKTLCKERGIDKDVMPNEWAAFRKEYNNAANLSLELVKSGMDGGKGVINLSYSNPDKHKARQVGDVKEGTVLHKAMEVIRLKRIQAFLKSKAEKIEPEEIGLTEIQWCKAALAQFAVPSEYKKTTDSGSKVHSMETAKAWLVDFRIECLEAKSESMNVSESMEVKTEIESVSATKEKKGKNKAA